MNDLMTNDQVAERVGLSYDTLYSYRRRKTFPEPDTYYGRTPLWKSETIDNWLSVRKPKQKHPPEIEGTIDQ